MKRLLGVAVVLMVLGCAKPTAKPVRVTVSDDLAALLALHPDGGAVTLWGAAFQPSTTDTTTVLAFYGDSSLTGDLVDVSLLASGKAGKGTAPVRSYPSGDLTALPEDETSYLYLGPLPGRTTSYDGGTDVSVSSSTRMSGQFFFHQDVQPPTFCAACVDGLLHYSVSASFDVNSYPVSEDPDRGAQPQISGDDDG